MHVADLALPTSTTQGGPVGGFGSRTVTGGAVSADGRVVALRTYTDAWLFPVPDGGGVADALRGTAPVQVPLPGEPQGEAVAFAADGALLSGSEGVAGWPGRSGRFPGPPGWSPRRPEPATDPAPNAAPNPAAAPAAEPVPVWRTAAIGAGALVVILGLLAVAMLRHAARRG